MRIIIMLIMMLLGARELGDMYFYKKAIQEASAEFGLPYELMSKIAYIESNFDADAVTTTTSARGLYQITEATEEEIFRLCKIKGNIFSEVVNARMAACYMKQNEKRLRKALGRYPNYTELYLSHFLGYNGAMGILFDTDGLIDQERYKRQIKANPAVFLKDDGTLRTIKELKQFLRDKIRNARVL